MKTKHKLLSKAAAVFVTICMLFTLTPLNAFAFSADNYKAQIEKVSVGAPITSVDGGQYLPVTVYFSAAEDLGDSNAVYFLEGYLKATLGDGTTTEGIAGLGMTLMGPLKPDALAAVGSNAFSWEWSEGKGTGVLKYNIPLLNDGETQSAEKSPATGQVEVNGLKADDKVAFQIETVMNSSNFPPEVLPEGGSLMSDEFVIPIEDSSNYPKTITQSSGEEKCKHDGELKYEYVSDNQHNVICQKCGTVIETEGHTTSDEHKFFDKEYHWWVCKYCNAEFYKGSHHLNQNYDENTHWSECADPLCNYKTTPEKHDFTFHKNDDGTSECICGAIQAAPALPDLSKTTVEGVKEDKTYTKEEAEKLELSVDGKKLDKESYTVKVEDDENGKLIVTFEPIEGKSTGKKQVIVDAACKHDGELTYYAANAEQHTIFCEKCQKEIGVEDHDFTRHMTDTFYFENSETHKVEPKYGEADVCTKCGEYTNFVEKVKPDLSGAKALIEDLKKYTADEAKLIELELNGEKLDKDTYIVSVEKGENGTLIVTFEPVDEKSTGKKQIEVQCSHENTLWADHGDTCEKYCGDCGAFLGSSSHYFVWQDGNRLCAQCRKLGSINLDTATVENLEKGKGYTVEEAKQLELSLDGEKLNKDYYTVEVKGDETGKLIVTFEPVEGKSTEQKHIEVNCAHEKTHWCEDGNWGCYEKCEACGKVVTNTTNHSYDDLNVCTRCGHMYDAIEIYSIIEGAGQTVNKAQESAEFRVDCNYESFTGNVEVDGKQLTRDKDFTDKSGSTIITLTSDYLQTLTAGKHTIKVYFEDGYAETEFTVEDTSSHVASDDVLEKWSAKDYQDKTGTSANAEITAKGDDQYEITLTDDSGKVLDTYTINPDTGVGTDTAGNEVNLPQTGISDNRWVWIPLAALMCMMGIYLVRKSRKEDEES